MGGEGEREVSGEKEAGGRGRERREGNGEPVGRKRGLLEKGVRGSGSPSACHSPPPC